MKRMKHGDRWEIILHESGGSSGRKFRAWVISTPSGGKPIPFWERPLDKGRPNAVVAKMGSHTPLVRLEASGGNGKVSSISIIEYYPDPVKGCKIHLQREFRKGERLLLQDISHELPESLARFQLALEGLIEKCGCVYCKHTHYTRRRRISRVKKGRIKVVRGSMLPPLDTTAKGTLKRAKGRWSGTAIEANFAPDVIQSVEREVRTGDITVEVYQHGGGLLALVR